MSRFSWTLLYSEKNAFLALGWFVGSVDQKLLPELG